MKKYWYIWLSYYGYIFLLLFYSGRLWFNDNYLRYKYKNLPEARRLELLLHVQWVLWLFVTAMPLGGLIHLLNWWLSQTAVENIVTRIAIYILVYLAGVYASYRFAKWYHNNISPLMKEED